jgi:Raf kinase inhibitor-like YbhB/YbcL family protein
MLHFPEPNWRLFDMKTFRIWSPAFEEGENLPEVYSRSHQNFSPPLCWEAVPEGTRELALVCEDPDSALDGPWLHWVIYQIPPHLRGFEEGISNSQDQLTEEGILQGLNSWDEEGYGGPQPPLDDGKHRYVFRLFALDLPLSLKPGATAQELYSQMNGRILGEAHCIATYENSDFAERQRSIRDSIERSYNKDLTRSQPVF